MHHSKEALFQSSNHKSAFRSFLVLMFLLSFTGKIFSQNLDKNAINVFIKKHAAELNFTAENLENYRIRDAYFDNLSGAMLVYLQQTYSGIDVYNSIQVLAIKNDKVGSFMGHIVPMSKGSAVEKNATPSLTPADAVRAALTHLKLTVPFLVRGSKVKQLANEYEFGKLNATTNNIKGRLLWLAGEKIKKNTLIWQIEIQPAGSSDYWMVKVDAKNGIVLGKENLTIYCNWNVKNNITVHPLESIDERITLETTNNTSLSNNANQKVFGKSPTALNSANYTVVKYPVESPKHPGGTPVTVTNPWELSPVGSLATTLNWHEDGINTYDSTRGNNVLAKEDRDGNNEAGFGSHSLTPAPDLNLTYPPDFTLDPTQNINKSFAITNLFYWCNLMHDMSYAYGFDEASGNFQANNQGRGGIGNDYVLADAQDGMGFNNANFGTPGDGENPRMQMYLWDAPNPDLDGDVDNSIVCHEYGHGISNRLTGGPLAATALSNEEQMGEGWSDYFALMMTTNWATATINDGVLPRTIATYANGEAPTGVGIRSKPYSTDMVVNNLTYRNVTKGNPISSFLGLSVHYVGEVWVEALWEMTWGLIQQEGINTNFFNPDGAGGNSVAMKLVVMGLKLQSASPGFVDGRDAILKADTLLYNGKYSCIIWKAFAKRGLGVNATQGSPYNYKDQVENFNEPNKAVIQKVADKITAEQGEEINYTFTTTCQCADITNYTITDTLPANVTYVSGGTYDATTRTVKFSNVNLTKNNSVSYTAKVIINAGTYSPTVEHLNETIPTDVISADWVLANSGNPNWHISTNLIHSAPYSFFVDGDVNPGSATLTTKNAIALSGVSYLNFWHYWNTEASYDGAWLEISSDNGITWSDISRAAFIKNGYNNNLLIATKSVRKAFSGNGPGWVESIVDLSPYAGKSVKIRFQYSCDEGTNFEGWYLDDIKITSESGVYNTAHLFDEASLDISRSAAITNINGEVIPVIWGSFSAVKQNNTSILTWSTLTEQNTDLFIVERSVLGSGFIEIGRVKAAGYSNSEKTYSYNDNSPSVGDNLYRIRQMDKDGKFLLTEIRNLNFSDIISLIKITPNPASDFIKLLIPGNTGVINVSIINATGKIVYQQKITGELNNINLPHLASGYYHIQLLGEGVNYKQKIMVKQ